MTDPIRLGGGGDPFPGRGVPGAALGFDALRSGRISGDEARLEAAEALLESEFYQLLFQAMRETVPEEAPGSGPESEIFWSLLSREVADRAALAGGKMTGVTHPPALPTAEGDGG